MAEGQVRPGFNLELTFKGHLSNVRKVLHNPNQNYFISSDDKSLKAWAHERNGGCRVLYDVAFPGYQASFVMAMAFARDINMLFAACLDGSLRVYNDRLVLKSTMPWFNGVVRDIVYNPRRQEIITAGSYGVKVWECELDHEAYRTDKDVDPYAIPRTKDGKVVLWCFGKYQHARQRLHLNIPGAHAVGGTKPEQANTASQAGWCERILLHEPSQTLLAIFEGSIYGFEMQQGTMTISFVHLHDLPITGMLYLPETDLLVTTTADSAATVWRIAGGMPHRFKQCGKTSVPTNYVATDNGGATILSSSLDGSITLWSAESWEPIYKMKLPKTAHHPTFYEPNKLFLHTDNEVKLFSIQHLYASWMECNSQPLSLRQLSYGLVLAEFADSSVRVLDCHSNATDKSVITTVPQLSTYNMVAVTCGLAAARLFTLLSNGHVHIWELHLKRPPTFLDAWTHLARDRCCNIVFMDGGALDKRAVDGLGLLSDEETGNPHDHLILGTSTGDCLICNIQNGGSVVFRFPAFKHQPLEQLVLDLDRGLLLTSSKNMLKIWNLNELKCMHMLETSHPISKLDTLEGRAIIGTASGSVHLVDMLSGRRISASATSDHMDCITGIGPSVSLQHFVTCSRDSTIKVFDRDKTFKGSIYIASPIACCCYLNDEGDILAGIQKRLVVVRAGKYDLLPTEDDSVRLSIYDGLKGKGTNPRALLRSVTSHLQRLSSAMLPQTWLSEINYDPEEDLHQMIDPGSKKMRMHKTQEKSVDVASATASPGLQPKDTKRLLERHNTLAMVIRNEGERKSTLSTPAPVHPTRPVQTSSTMPSSAAAAPAAAATAATASADAAAAKPGSPASTQRGAPPLLTAPPPPPPSRSAAAAAAANKIALATPPAGSSPAAAATVPATPATSIGLSTAPHSLNHSPVPALMHGPRPMNKVKSRVRFSLAGDVASAAAAAGHAAHPDGTSSSTNDRVTNDHGGANHHGSAVNAGCSKPSTPTASSRGSSHGVDGSVASIATASSSGAAADGGHHQLQPQQHRAGSRSSVTTTATTATPNPAPTTAGSLHGSVTPSSSTSTLLPGAPPSSSSANSSTRSGSAGSSGSEASGSLYSSSSHSGSGTYSHSGSEDARVSEGDSESVSGSESGSDTGSGSETESGSGTDSENGSDSDTASESGAGKNPSSGRSSRAGWGQDSEPEEHPDDADDNGLHHLTDTQIAAAIAALQGYEKRKILETLYHISFKQEAERRERKMHGLDSFKVYEASELGSEGGSSSSTGSYSNSHSHGSSDSCSHSARLMKVGTLEVEVVDPPPDTSAPDEAAQALEGPLPDDSALLFSSGTGLAAAFRHALPIICSGSAFLTGTPIELLTAARDRAKAAAQRRAAHKAKQRKSGSRKGKTDATTSAIAGSAAAVTAPAPAAAAADTAGGIKMNSILKLLATGTATGGAQDKEQRPTEKQKQKSKKKKKQRKARKKSMLEVVNPAKALALSTKQTAVHAELKDFERHRMLTKTVTQGFLPQLAPKAKARARSNSQGGGNVQAAAAHSEADETPRERDTCEPPDFQTVLRAYRYGWTPAYKAVTSIQFLTHLHEALAEKKAAAHKLGAKPVKPALKSVNPVVIIKVEPTKKVTQAVAA